jgi:hypothetical protein
VGTWFVRKLSLACLLAGLALAAPARADEPIQAKPVPAQPVPAQLITYDSFMKTERPPRGDAFRRLSPENRVLIMKTHMQRWRAAHEADLSEPQKALIEENIATLHPDFYREPTPPEWRDKVIRLFQKAEPLFTREEMRELFTLDGEPPSGPK